MNENIDAISILLGAMSEIGLKYTFEKMNSVLKKYKYKLQNETKFTTDTFIKLLNEVFNWSSVMEYRPMNKVTELSKLYINLDLYVEPISEASEEVNKKINLKKALRKLNSHLVLLGRPGSGKTTTIKSICYDLITGRGVLSEFVPCPIVIRLREIDSRISLYEILLKKLNFNIVDRNGQSIKINLLSWDVQKDLIVQFFNDNKFLIIFDGFDEINNVDMNFLGYKTKTKDKFIFEFQVLCNEMNYSLMILTSRTADYYSINSIYTTTYELCRLNENQVKNYLKKYFPDDAQRAKAENSILNKKLLGTEYIPLTLAFLCIIFSKYGKLFNSRRETYNKLLDLLLEDWDLKRIIKRTSNFFNFDVFDKKRFLRELSFELTLNYNNSSYFNYLDIENTLAKIYVNYDNLSKKDFKLILSELETHTGLFIKSGNGYMFSHETVREYLFATYLYEFPEIPKDLEMLMRIPNELALAVSFNENPSLYLSYLIMNRFNLKFYSKEFLFPFIDRILLEDTTFKIHAYLGISTILMYDNIRKQAYHLSDNLLQEKLKYFYKFLNCDGRIGESIKRLSGYYKITDMNPDKNEIIITKIKTIDSKTNYNEPEILKTTYDFFDVFNNNIVEL